jgi:molybdopterin-guanine dinucleotide biosynthesis protein A
MNGAVLTGGSSRRFGAPKALVEVEGIPMAVRVGQALIGAGCSPVFAVGDIPGLANVWRAETDGGPQGFGPLVADLFPGEGPLGGIVTALDFCSSDLITAACDLPWLNASEIQQLRATAEAKFEQGVLCVHGLRNGRMFPVLCWSAQAVPVLMAAFEAGERSLRGVLAELPTSGVEFEAQYSRGVNSPDDLNS